MSRYSRGLGSIGLELGLGLLGLALGSSSRDHCHHHCHGRREASLGTWLLVFGILGAVYAIDAITTAPTSPPPPAAARAPATGQ